MNQPLRYEGKAFYQASFGKGDTLSILQVVENPGWLLPYVSCVLVTIGLIVHFAITLRRSSKRRQAARWRPEMNLKRAVAWIAVRPRPRGRRRVAAPRRQASAASTSEAFGQLPVLEGGRVKPLDSIARNALLVIRGQQSVPFEGAQPSAPTSGSSTSCSAPRSPTGSRSSSSTIRRCSASSASSSARTATTASRPSRRTSSEIQRQYAAADAGGAEAPQPVPVARS